MGDADEMGPGERLAAPGQEARDRAGLQQELRAWRRADISAERTQLQERGLGKILDLEPFLPCQSLIFFMRAPPLIGLAAGFMSSRSLSAVPLSGGFGLFALALFALLLAFFTGLSLP
jgi:hypothetical protein